MLATLAASAPAAAQIDSGLGFIVSGLGLFLALALWAAPIVFIVVVLWRMMKAQERTAAATERAARALENRPTA